jgi:hypothetical protein
VGVRIVATGTNIEEIFEAKEKKEEKGKKKKERDGGEKEGGEEEEDKEEKEGLDKIRTVKDTY